MKTNCWNKVRESSYGGAQLTSFTVAMLPTFGHASTVTIQGIPHSDIHYHCENESKLKKIFRRYAALRSKTIYHFKLSEGQIYTSIFLHGYFSTFCFWYLNRTFPSVEFFSFRLPMRRTLSVD